MSGVVGGLILLGVILIVVGVILPSGILTTLGAIAAAVGVVLLIANALGVGTPR